MPADRLSRHPSRRSLLGGLGGLAAGFSLGACARDWPIGANGEQARLNLLNWDTYTGETTLADFKAATGVTVRMSLFANNDELFARLRAGNPGYDVIVPSNEFVTRLRLANLLMPLDRARIPNFANLLPEFQTAAFDPGRRWSMPYTWLVLGVGYRKSRIPAPPDSWRWLFDSPCHSGRIGLIAEADDLIRLGALYLGTPPDAVTPAVIARVTQMLIAQKPHIKIFHHDEGQDLLAAGDLDLAIEYNGDMAQVIADDPDLAFIVPREGSLLNSDCLCIPRGAPRPDNAHAFINHVLGARAGADIARTIRYPTPNAAALALMPAEYRDNLVIFPPDLARSHYGRYAGLAHARAVDEAITQVLAA